MPTLLTAVARAVHGEGAVHTLALDEAEPPFQLGDGEDHWDALSRGGPGRSEMLHIAQAEGSLIDASWIRVGDLKFGHSLGCCNSGPCPPPGTCCAGLLCGWYPPPAQLPDARATVECGDLPPSLVSLDCTEEEPCLFNITADPCEHHNLAPDRPDEVARLGARLAEYAATAVLPWTNFCREPDPRADPAKFGGVWTPWEAGGWV